MVNFVFHMFLICIFSVSEAFETGGERDYLCHDEGECTCFPDVPYDLVWERTGASEYQISWQGSAHARTFYLVFAANDACDVSQLVAQTDQAHIVVDGRFFYYRVVAVHEGVLSRPSEILYLEAGAEPLKSAAAKSVHASAEYHKSKYVDDAVWESVTPYLLPPTHPLKLKLDEIFNSGRVTANVESMKEAGFVFNKQLGLHVVVARHSSLKGVVVKAYVDHLSKEEDWQKWVTRVQAANAIRTAINLHGYKSIFKVPKKWIYPLPDNSSPPDSPDYMRKHFILIAEDMKLLEHKENKVRYRSSFNKKTMQAVYVLCEELGLADTPRIHNLPWTKDHHLAFVDTEAFQRWPVKYHPLVQYLDKGKRPLWMEITAGQRQE